MEEREETIGTVTNVGQDGNIHQMPWLDLRLSTEAMNHLWESINTPQQEIDARQTLAGNITKSVFIQDKDNWFYDNVLKKFAEYVYFKNWDNYYETVVAKIVPPPVFTCHELWVNYQKKHEFNPPHGHNGGIGFSFVVFMKIPTHWEEQHALPLCINANAPRASDFEFLLGHGREVQPIAIQLSPEDEGRMFFFPAWLIHQVFPFYECEEDRITISGNISKVEDIGRTVKIPAWRTDRDEVTVGDKVREHVGDKVREQGRNLQRQKNEQTMKRAKDRQGGRLSNV